MPVRYDVYARARDFQAGAVRLSSRILRRWLAAYLLLLIPFAYLAGKYGRYALDGDAVAYMDLADQIRTHHWSQAVNGYWNPLYPVLLSLAQVTVHSSLFNELRAYYAVNYLLFALQIAAVLIFVRSLAHWRVRVLPHVVTLLPTPALQLIGVTLQVSFLNKELAISRISPDGLLEALLLLALAMLLETLAATSVAGRTAASLGAGGFFGLAFLTKSVALPLALIAILLLLCFSKLRDRSSAAQAVLSGMIVAVAFTALAGPYILAVSRQKHRLDISDSGALNYAWNVSGTQKSHLEPWMTDRFGSAKVHLIHPEAELAQSPGVYTYSAHPSGTYPPWFDSSWFNERIIPVFSLRRQVPVWGRNLMLTVRYLVDHPEPLLLLAILLLSVGRVRFDWNFAGLCLCFGFVLWLLYASVALEQRYVSIAYVIILIPLFASLEPRTTESPNVFGLRHLSQATVLLCALIIMAELVRTDAENRRNLIVSHALPAWKDHEIYGAAEALTQLGLKPGDSIACIGNQACLFDQYWARVAGVRILTEVYLPDLKRVADQLDDMSNREAVMQTVKNSGARVLVGSFDPGDMNASHPAATGWQRLGETSFYALPLNLPAGPSAIH